MAIKDLDESLHILLVEFQNGECFALVIDKKVVTHVMRIDSTFTFYGNRTLDLVTFRLEREQTKLTLGKATDQLEYFYKVMLKSKPRFLNLRTNFFSYWRFAHDAKEENEFGICHISNDEKTLWSIFEAGDLVGGWFVKNSYDSPESLSVDRVLEEAVRINGKISYHHNESKFIEMKTNTVLVQDASFPVLLHPDSKERLLMSKFFGEKGFELACMFNGRKTIGECATEAKVNPSEMISVAQFLGDSNLCVRA